MIHVIPMWGATSKEHRTEQKRQGQPHEYAHSPVKVEINIFGVQSSGQIAMEEIKGYRIIKINTSALIAFALFHCFPKCISSLMHGCGNKKISISKHLGEG